ncbi:DUF333 domain-containing protein [Candidatus Gracilibacteria bacterium]|nr:DUF333 domain-containing protein [Candidatus Gracilibacteria bacterium]
MKKSIFALSAVALLSLASCGTPVNTPVESVSTGSTATTQKDTPSYATSQKETPATKFCTKNGGTVSFETKGEGNFKMDIAYCTVGGEKKDAWAYFNEATSATGATETGTTQTGATAR